MERRADLNKENDLTVRAVCGELLFKPRPAVEISFCSDAATGKNLELHYSFVSSRLSLWVCRRPARNDTVDRRRNPEN
jgi:hypothetical protein